MPCARSAAWLGNRGRTPAGGACPGIPRLAGGDGGLAVLRDREVSLEQRLDRLLLALYGVLAVLAQTLGVNLCKRRLDDARLLRLGLALQGCGLLLFALVDSSFWLVCALLPFALGSLATRPCRLLGPRAGRPPGRVAGRAEQPDEPRRDRRSAADERPVPLGQRSARAAALAGARIPRRRPSRSGRAGPGLATSTYGEERSWTG